LARRAHAQPATLSIAQWAHFVPTFDEWFDGRFAREWGERNGVRVVVDHFSVYELRSRALAEVAARRGHDLFALLAPPAAFEAHVLPLNDVVAECERRFGKPVALAHHGTYNPKTQKYFALSDSWAPDPVHYRADWWDAAGVKPDTWDRVREGARRIKERHGAHAGLGLAREIDTEMTLRGLLWAFGATEQDESGRVTINSKATMDAIKLMTAIYRESMTPEVFMWDPSSNNRFFVWGGGSIIQNAISAIRTAEKLNPEVARKTALAPAPAGPRARLSPAHVVHCYVVWKFAQSPALAKRFLVDLVAASNEAFLASEFYNLPSFPQAVADLRGKLAADRQSPGTYTVLADAERWSASIGHPGYATAAIDEILHAHVISSMFARAARGEQTAEECARRAETEMRRIVQRWTR
jgi:multiple sugar transport system substrate-binding protein